MCSAARGRLLYPKSRNIPNLNAAMSWDVPYFYASVFRQGINALASVCYDKRADGRVVPRQNSIRLPGNERVPNANRAVWPARYQYATL